MIPGKASVIIPVYNKGPYLAEAIESALKQTYSNYDVLVVNDGSTDSSLAIARSFEPRIRVIDQVNDGVSAARNHGVRFTDAEFFAPLDADDKLDQDFLAKTTPMMADQAVGIVATDMQYFGLRNNYIAARGLTLEAEMRTNELPVCSLVRKKAFLQTNGYERQAWPGEDAIIYEDWEFWIQILKRGWRAVAIHEPLLFHRISQVSMSAPSRDDRGGYQSRWDRLYHNMRKMHPDLWPEG